MIPPKDVKSLNEDAEANISPKRGKNESYTKKQSNNTNEKQRSLGKLTNINGCSSHRLSKSIEKLDISRVSHGEELNGYHKSKTIAEITPKGQLYNRLTNLRKSAPMIGIDEVNEGPKLDNVVTLTERIKLHSPFKTHLKDDYNKSLLRFAERKEGQVVSIKSSPHIFFGPTEDKSPRLPQIQQYSSVTSLMDINPSSVGSNSKKKSNFLSYVEEKEKNKVEYENLIKKSFEATGPKIPPRDFNRNISPRVSRNSSTHQLQEASENKSDKILEEKVLRRNPIIAMVRRRKNLSIDERISSLAKEVLWTKSKAIDYSKLVDGDNYDFRNTSIQFNEIYAKEMRKINKKPSKDKVEELLHMNINRGLKDLVGEMDRYREENRLKRENVLKECIRIRQDNSALRKEITDKTNKKAV